MDPRARPREPERPRSVTLVGWVEEGVEHGSVVLRDDTGKTWQIGSAGAPWLGRRVRVRGRTRPGLLTTAQQGIPLHVIEMTRLDDDPPGY